MSFWLVPMMLIFQPTLPARGATTPTLCSTQSAPFQPTLPARGATATRRHPQRNRGNFNPRSPHGERPALLPIPVAAIQFQPTLPARGATPDLLVGHVAVLISTHAPRTGSDDVLLAGTHDVDISTHAPRTGSDVVGGCNNPRLAHDFNPRSPHGERPIRYREGIAPGVFQPTLPARGATARRGVAGCGIQHFNPRSPHGERHAGSHQAAENQQFQPTLPARGATKLLLGQSVREPFQPTLPARGATLLTSTQS